MIVAFSHYHGVELQCFFVRDSCHVK